MVLYFECIGYHDLSEIEEDLANPEPFINT